MNLDEFSTPIFQSGQPASSGLDKFSTKISSGGINQNLQQFPFSRELNEEEKARLAQERYRTYLRNLAEQNARRIGIPEARIPEVTEQWVQANLALQADSPSPTEAELAANEARKTLPPLERGYATEIGAALGTGLLDLQDSALGVSQGVIDNLPLSDDARIRANLNIGRYSQGVLDLRPMFRLSDSLADKEFDPTNPKWWVAGGARMTPQLGMQAAIAGVTGGASLPKQLLGFAATGGAMEAGSAYNEARERMLQRGATLQEATRAATTEAGLVGAVNSAIEILPGYAILKKNPAARQVFNQTLRSRLAGVAGKAAGGFVSEGAEEATQDAWTDTVRWMVENDPESFGEWRKYAGSFALGGLAGAGFGGGAAIAEDAANSQQIAKANRQAVERAKSWRAFNDSRNAYDGTFQQIEATKQERSQLEQQQASGTQNPVVPGVELPDGQQGPPADYEAMAKDLGQRERTLYRDFYSNPASAVIWATENPEKAAQLAKGGRYTAAAFSKADPELPVLQGQEGDTDTRRKWFRAVQDVVNAPEDIRAVYSQAARAGLDASSDQIPISRDWQYVGASGMKIPDNPNLEVHRGPIGAFVRLKNRPQIQVEEPQVVEPVQVPPATQVAPPEATTIQPVVEPVQPHPLSGRKVVVSAPHLRRRLVGTVEGLVESPSGLPAIQIRHPDGKTSVQLEDSIQPVEEYISSRESKNKQVDPGIRDFASDRPTELMPVQPSVELQSQPQIQPLVPPQSETPLTGGVADAATAGPISPNAAGSTPAVPPSVQLANQTPEQVEQVWRQYFPDRRIAPGKTQMIRMIEEVQPANPIQEQPNARNPRVQSAGDEPVTGTSAADIAIGGNQAAPRVEPVAAQPAATPVNQPATETRPDAGRTEAATPRPQATALFDSQGEGVEQADQPVPVPESSFAQVPVESLKLDPDRFQFKSDAGREGVVAGDQLEGEFNPLAAGAILVWESKGGDRFVVNGHHRYDLAKRKQRPTIAVQLVREQDGYTENDARALGAELNILEGQGKINDYATFFRESQITEDDARTRGLLARDKGRTGFAIGRFAGDDVWSAFQAGNITADRAAAISEAGKDDEGLQALGIKKARQGVSAEEIRHTLDVLRQFPRTTEKQGDLFGFDDSAIQEAEKMAAAAKKIIQGKKDRLLAVQGALRRPEQAQQMGLSGDFDSIGQEARQIIEDIDRWQRWTTDPELANEVRIAAGLAPRQPQRGESVALVEPIAEQPPKKPGFPKKKPVEPATDEPFRLENEPSQPKPMQIENTGGKQKSFISGIGRDLPGQTTMFDVDDFPGRRESSETKTEAVPAQQASTPDFTNEADIEKWLLGEAEPTTAKPAGLEPKKPGFKKKHPKTSGESKPETPKPKKPAAKKESERTAQARAERDQAASELLDAIRKSQSKLTSGVDPSLLAPAAKLLAKEIAFRTRQLQDAGEAVLHRWEDVMQSIRELVGDDNAEMVRPAMEEHWRKLRSAKPDMFDELKLPQEATPPEQPKTTNAEAESPKLDVPTVLQQSGIVVAKAKTKTGKDVWEVTGKTYDHKDTIKKLGGKFYGPKKAWTFYDADPSEKLAAAISGRPSGEPNGSPNQGPANATETGDADGEDVARKQRREAEDARPDRSRIGGDTASLLDSETRRLIERGSDFHIPDAVIADQIEDVALAKRAFQEGSRVFVLANEAGTGKTYVLGGAIRELRQLGAKKFTYVTMNQDLIEQIKSDLNDYGMEGVSFSTYSDLSKKKGGVDSDTVLIFDEAHNVKNSTGSKRGKTAQEMMQTARFTILSTATPFENPVQASYLDATGIFDGVGGHREWAKMYGADVIRRKYFDYRQGREVVEEILRWTGGKHKQADQIAARAWFGRQGVFTQRNKKLPAGMVSSNFRKSPVASEWVDKITEIQEVYKRASNKAVNDQMAAAQIAMHATNVYKRILEAAKVGMAIDRAKALIADGKQAVLFVETKADRHIGRFRKTGDSNGKLYTFPEIMEEMRLHQAQVAAARAMRERPPSPPFADFIVKIASEMYDAGIDYELPSVVDDIRAAFDPDEVAMYTGEQTANVAKRGLSEWKAGRKKLLIATMAKGGTGLSLHDTTGKQPERVQVGLNLPWTATQVDQTSGRLARYGTAKPVGIEWLFADNVGFERDLARRVGSRMIDMGATVKGMEVGEAEAIADFDFEDGFNPRTVPGNKKTLKKQPTDDVAELYRQAATLEKTRKKADNTDGDFFETPYPLAVAMQRIAGIQAGDSILEPSAGRGNLLRFIPDGTKIKAIEQRRDNLKYLEKLPGNPKDATYLQGDFLEQEIEDSAYDAVLMNPPFSRKTGVGPQDVAHIQRAYEYLNPNGRLVAIMGEGAFFRQSKQDTEFRDWLDDVGATVIKLPEKTFKQSGTNVNVRMVVIDRNADPGRSDIQLTDMDVESLRDLEEMVSPRQREIKQPSPAVKKAGFLKKINSSEQSPQQPKGNSIQQASWAIDDILKQADDETSEPAVKPEGNQAMAGGVNFAGSLGVSVSGSTPIQQSPGSPLIPVEMAPPAGFEVPKYLPNHHEIIRTMEKLFGVPIRVGKTSRGQLGIYKYRPEIVRMAGQASGDLAVASHEVAHHLDKTFDPYRGASQAAKNELKLLDYEPQKQRITEGFAEYMRLFLTDPSAAETLAPRFHQEFTEGFLKSNRDLSKKVWFVRSLADKWRIAGAKARNKLSTHGKPARPVSLSRLDDVLDWASGATHKAYAAIKDEGHFLNLFTKEARKAGAKFDPGQSPYELYQFFAQSGPTLANSAINDGVFDVVTMKKLGPSLRDVFESLEDGEYSDWVQWAWARHAIEVWDTKRINPGISRADADSIFSSVDEKTAKRWGKAADRLKQFNDSMIEMLANSGVISKSTARKIIDEYKTYVPLHRVQDNTRRRGLGGLGARKIVDVAEPLRRRRGSGAQVIDPVIATIERSIRFYQRAAQQQVIEQIVDTAERTGGLGSWVERIPPGMQKTTIQLSEAWPAVLEVLDEMGVDISIFGEDIDPNSPASKFVESEMASELLNIWRPNYFYRGSKPIARIIRNGQQSLYEFDKEMFRAVSGVEFFQLPKVLDFLLAGPVRLLKTGATGLNPDFAAFNPIRDYMTFLLQRKNAKGIRGAAFGPAEMVAAYVWSEIQEMRGNDGDPVVRLFKDFGGELSTYLGLDKARMSRVLNQNLMHKGRAKLGERLSHPVDTIRDVISVSEVGPRLAEFRAVLKKYGWDSERIRREGSPPRDVVVEGINAANEVTVDFRRMGWVGKHINQVVPYFNAQLEGLDKAIRTAKDNPARLFWRLSTTLVPLAIMYWFLNKDRDWYKEKEPWMNGYWFLTDSDGKPYGRIPKPHEWGLLATGIEAILDLIYKRDPQSIQDTLGNAADTVRPETRISLVHPLYEDWANKDSFLGAPIVPENLMNREPKDQFTSGNTLLMRKIGEELNMSPARIEHLVDGYTGGLYSRTTLPIEKAVAGQEFQMSDIPGIGAFSLRKEYTRSVGDFYDAFHNAEQRYNSAKDRGELTPELESEFFRLSSYRSLISSIRQPAKAEETRDGKFEFEKFATGMAREALDREPLERYPTIWSVPESELPAEVAKIRGEYLGSKLVALTNPRPERRDGESIEEFSERKKEHESDISNAAKFLKNANISREEQRRLLKEASERRGWGTKPGLNSAFGKRLMLLNPRMGEDQ